jgi:hypothetical protein
VVRFNTSRERERERESASGQRELDAFIADEPRWRLERRG